MKPFLYESKFLFAALAPVYNLRADSNFVAHMTRLVMFRTAVKTFWQGYKR
jgi:hypothetical protein